MHKCIHTHNKTLSSNDIWNKGFLISNMQKPLNFLNVTRKYFRHNSAKINIKYPVKPPLRFKQVNILSYILPILMSQK